MTTPCMVCGREATVVAMTETGAARLCGRCTEAVRAGEERAAELQAEREAKRAELQRRREEGLG